MRWKYVQQLNKSVVRIGRADPTKKRPIKVAMENEEDKNKIISSLRNLKGQAAYQKISVSDDYTIAERQSIKEYSDKAKDNNAKEPVDSRFVWRVRGNPKNGLLIKKFLKYRPMVHPQVEQNISNLL